MIISKNKRFIFTRIGRTGTTSMKACLRKYADTKIVTPYKHHIPMRIVESQLDLSDFFKFCFVRNPWDLTVSRYHYCKNRKKKGYAGIPVCKNARKMPFKEWALHKEHIYTHYEQRLSTMTDFMVSDDGTMLIDKVYKFEDIQAAFRDICRKLKIREVLPHYNSTKHSHYRDYYDRASERFIAKVFKEDIERFGYRF